MSSKTSTHKSNPRKNSNFVSPISIDLGAKKHRRIFCSL